MKQRYYVDTIVVPQGAEYQAVCRGLRRAKAEIAVLKIPIGTNNVAETLANYSARLANSQQLLILGLCGSLDPAYKVGHRVLVRRCQDLEGNRVECDRQLTLKLQDKLSIDLVSGLTSDRPIVKAVEKLELSRQYPVSVVEMEGYSYVSQLQKQGKAVAMLRVVSDDLNQDLPNLERAIDRQGNLQTIPLAIAFLQQPLSAMRLIRGSLAGLKALEQLVVQLFSEY